MQLSDLFIHSSASSQGGNNEAELKQEATSGASLTEQIQLLT